jgi:hypothetical protein
VPQSYSDILLMFPSLKKNQVFVTENWILKSFDKESPKIKALISFPIYYLYTIKETSINQCEMNFVNKTSQSVPHIWI